MLKTLPDGRIDLRSATLPELTALLTGRLGVPAFRARQVYSWLSRGVTDFALMTNLSLELRQQLAAQFFIPGAVIVRRQVSKLDSTVKYLFSLYDGALIESVVLHYHHGHTICISTQAGCRMGCTFCATGMNGLTRNLLPAEMLAQITAAQEDLSLRISNVVMMGMGEPLDNFDNVDRFLTLVSDPDGLNIGARHISLSTCGLADKIRLLARQNRQITLSVSLHAPNDTLRSNMMPVNRKWNIEQLLSACRDYIAVTGRRISFEYTLVSGVNDSPACADELAARLRGMLCHVNLIPLNEVTGKSGKASTPPATEAFRARLEHRGINATVRRTLGADISASCGQLRAEEQKTS